MEQSNKSKVLKIVLLLVITGLVIPFVITCFKKNRAS